MNTVIREVGFLALGGAAVLEGAIYYRWFNPDQLATLSFLLLLGLYFACDGASWGKFAALVRGKLEMPSKLPGLAVPPEKDVIDHFETHFTRPFSVFWRLDFAALVCGFVALGATVQRLKDEGHALEDKGHALEPAGHVAYMIKDHSATPTVAPVLVAAVALGIYCMLTCLYWLRWSYAARSDDKSALLLRVADAYVWSGGWSVCRNHAGCPAPYFPLIFYYVAIICCAFAISVGLDASSVHWECFAVPALGSVLILYAWIWKQNKLATWFVRICGLLAIVCTVWRCSTGCAQS
jgi:hypothetical protein